MIYNEIGEVISNQEISEGIYKTVFNAPLIAHNSRPGQFVNILPYANWNHVMRRPMSIAHQGNDELSIIYKPIGEGTNIMKNWATGDLVDNIGPLGNYWQGYEDTFPILIGGGVGIAPILNLHNHLNALHINHTLICGAQTKKEHFFVL